MEYIKIHTDFIKLQQALKLANVVGQGSDAKMIIQDGLVKVNDEVCTMRGKKCVVGDIIAVSGKLYDNGQEFVFEIK